jgi:excinuclease ABC subunit B
MKTALEETERRRKIQHEFNLEHHIQPKSIVTTKKQPERSLPSEKPTKAPASSTKSVRRKIADLEKKMLEASENLLFEEAAAYRDEIRALQDMTQNLEDK